MTDELPARPAELTPEMLNDLLVGTLDGGTITSVEAHDIGEGTGIFGQIARLDLSVEGDAGNAPETVVAKMACTQPANLEVAMMLGLYDREIKMFEHVLDETPITTPACHGTVQQDGGQFLLLLENMSVAYDVGDQIVGATLLQAEATIDALAAMHAVLVATPRTRRNGLAARSQRPAVCGRRSEHLPGRPPGPRNGMG